MRKILHVDMDAFYASVEQRDDAQLRGKPIAVGGGEKRGVLTTCSYEARVFGVRSALPGYKAKELCPEIIFVPPRFDVYKEVSHQIRNIFARYSDLIEPLSLDEAYLDVTQCKKDIIYATDIAKAIKSDIYRETQLTASAGVSYCKFIAKIASDIDKPNGLTVIKPHQALSFIERLPIHKFYGVGKVTAKKMNDLGIFTGYDLKQWSQVDLIHKFGKTGKFYYDIVRGIDDRPVKANRIRKSLAVERTFEENLVTLKSLEERLLDIAAILVERLQRVDKYGRTITLKLKTSNFENITRSKSLVQPITTEDEIIKIGLQLLRDNYQEGMSIRLLGLTSSNFDQPSSPSSSGGQLELSF